MEELNTPNFSLVKNFEINESFNACFDWVAAWDLFEVACICSFQPGTLFLFALSTAGDSNT
jgi:hypothetical protein